MTAKPKHKFSGNVKTVKTKEAFLRAYPENGTIRATAEEIGIKAHTVYSWRIQDPEFRQAVNNLDPMVADTLVDEAIRRAHDGVDEPVFQNGKLVGKVRKYSDRLLSQLIKGYRPEKFGDKMELDAKLKNGTLEDVSTADLLLLIKQAEKK